MLKLHSRAHKLNKHIENCDLYIKREDELSFGVSGTKLRKYSSLIPYFKDKEIKEVVVIGGKNSNNSLAAAQVLIENQISPYFLLVGESGYSDYYSNYDFLKILVPDEQIKFVSREQWPEVENLAQKWKPKAFLLKEGASIEQAKPGSKELYESVIKNQEELNIEFDHIFLDSGTGFTSECFLEQHKKTGELAAEIHVVNVTQEGNSLIDSSFGAVSKKNLQFIKEFAQSEGVLLDPVYNAKLFYTGFEKIPTEGIEGKVLFVHSGGGLGLVGYLEKLRRL